MYSYAANVLGGDRLGTTNDPRSPEVYVRCDIKALFATEIEHTLKRRGGRNRHNDIC